MFVPFPSCPRARLPEQEAISCCHAKLDSMQEGDGTVLDHSCLMFLSNMWIGRKHFAAGVCGRLPGALRGHLPRGQLVEDLIPMTEVVDD